MLPLANSVRVFRGSLVKPQLAETDQSPLYPKLLRVLVLYTTLLMRAMICLSSVKICHAYVKFDRFQFTEKRS